MPIVNYVREHIRFMEYASDEGLSSSERLLWYALMHVMNQRAQGKVWPDEFIRIEKTGSSVENHIERATFAIQSYARSLYRAAEINEMVKEAMDSIGDLADVFTSRRNTDYNFTDEETKHYRYQAVYQIIY